MELLKDMRGLADRWAERQGATSGVTTGRADSKSMRFNQPVDAAFSDIAAQVGWDLAHVKEYFALAGYLFFCVACAQADPNDIKYLENKPLVAATLAALAEVQRHAR